MTDLISRNAVLGMAFCAIKPTHDCQSVVSVVNVEDIENIPAIDAVPVVHARWIGGKYYNDVYGYEKTCTACKREYVVPYGYIYCPYCGAHMEE